MRAAAKPRALFIGGSINQTTQLHAVARELPDFESWFTPFYGDRGVELLRRSRLVEMTIAGNKRRGWCMDYLREHGLWIDMQGGGGGYDLVVTCTDLVVPKNVRGTPLVAVQEGIVDRPTRVTAICRRFRSIPRWLAGTSMTGESGLFDRYCVASEGYKDDFVARGAERTKVVVTGIPNFDDCRRYARNVFPYRGYVLVCTSDARETFQRDDRDALIRRALTLAAGRQLVFKLHPNESVARATREILRLAPSALVYSTGSAEEMIANCEVLLTQWSSTALVGVALGKEVHSDVGLERLRALMPMQNGGRSARNIAQVCRELLGRSDPRERANGVHSAQGAQPS